MVSGPSRTPWPRFSTSRTYSLLSDPTGGPAHRSVVLDQLEGARSGRPETRSGPTSAPRAASVGPARRPSIPRAASVGPARGVRRARARTPATSSSAATSAATVRASAMPRARSNGTGRSVTMLGRANARPWEIRWRESPGMRLPTRAPTQWVQPVSAVRCSDLGVDQSVADAPHVDDERGSTVGELRAQPARVRVQSARRYQGLVAPDVAQELLAREDPGRLAARAFAARLELLLGERTGSPPSHTWRAIASISSGPTRILPSPGPRSRRRSTRSDPGAQLE